MWGDAKEMTVEKTSGAAHERSHQLLNDDFWNTYIHINIYAKLKADNGVVVGGVTIYIYIYIYIRIHIFLYIVHICMYVCTNMYIYIYICTYIFKNLIDSVVFAGFL